MSQHSAVTTRSKLRKLAEEQSARRKDDAVTDSGLQPEKAPSSPSVAPTMASTSALNIPLTGGRVIDYTVRSTSEGPHGEQASVKGRHTSPRSRASSKNSRKSMEYLKKRIEYEAERELVQLKESLLKKRMEADIAELEATAESDDSNSNAGAEQRVEQWIDTTPQAGHQEIVMRPTSPVLCQSDAVLCTPSAARRPTDMAAPHEPTVSQRRQIVSTLDSIEHRDVSNILGTSASLPRAQTRTPMPTERVTFHLPNYPVFTTPATSVPRLSIPESDTRRQTKYGADEKERRTSGDRDSKIDRLAEAITSMTKPRPIPRQAYELPHFNGDPADWISYKNMYWDTTEQYNFKSHENLARLKTSLHGEAKISVEDLLRSGTDPNEIIRALDEEFGHPTLILKSALQKVRDLPRISESGRELRKFSSTVRNVVSLLKNIKADGYINNPQLVSELLSKLTPIQRAQYGDFAMGLDNVQGVDLRVSPNLEILSHFLVQLNRTTSYYVQASLIEPSTSKPPAKQQKQVYNQPRPMITARQLYNNNRPQLTHKINTQSDESSNIPKQCIVCQREHVIEECDMFKKFTVQQRWDTIKGLNTCFKCLVNKHPKRFCRANRCEKCGYGHHLLLHADKQKKDDKVIDKTESVTNIGQWRATSLLKIMPITLCNESGNNRQCYALLDDGATVSLIDSSIATELEGPRIPLTLKTAGGYGVTDLTSRAVQVKIKGPNGQCYDIKCRTMYNLNLPSQTVSAAMLSDNAHLRDLGCVEMRGAEPLLLLGQDNWQLLVGRDIRQGKSGKPVASLTKLGWVIHGPFDNNNNNDEQSLNCMTVSLPDLHDLVKSQFELESIGISQSMRKNANDERALEILNNTSRRVPDKSQWEVGLLWKHEDVELPNNYNQARQRLYGIEKRMQKDAGYAEAYSKQIDRLLEEGYARKIEGLSDNPSVWYLPHFGVMNPNKPGKLRLVFDAAAKSHGTCLNDNLLTGPDLLNSLLGILLKFRIGPIAFSGDIADMFMRIKIRNEDQSAQMFLWRGADQTKEPATYAMNSMIFGATSSPTTAIYILNKNASEFSDEYPQAVEAIRTKHYMDDYLDSAWSEDQASKLIEEVTMIHASGGFVIRGWVTNSTDLRDRLHSDMPERVALEKGVGISERTLGLMWAPKEDELAFDLSFKRLPKEIIDGSLVPTKRQFLSMIMSIYDPLGFLYPCVIQSRILMQTIWKPGIQWDQLDKLSDRGNWHWVPSEDNPADKATRLSWPDNHAAWLRGPLFLLDPQERWPVCREAEAVEADLERIQRVHATATPAAPLLDYERYSSWTRIQRVMAHVLIFIGRCRKRRSRCDQQWHFNPPAAPHMGGCWERLVRSTKNALHSTLKERAPREEVLYTLLAEAELIINSRPLSYVYDDHDQPVVLTPNHLLLGTASGSTPYAPGDIEDVDSRRQWRRVNALADMFWRRWLREYLPSLQRREKWVNNVPNVRISDVVVIADNNKNRSAWTKGIIKSVYHGKDGIIRVVDIKTVNGVLRRPVAKVIVLPTDPDVMRWNPVTGGGM